MTISLLDMTIEQLQEALAKTVGGVKPYRTKQLADWVYKKGVTDTDRMTNIPADLLAQVQILTSRVQARSDSRDGCVKLLLELHDGHRIETVLIPSEHRATACVSTQAGCAMSCVFCASGMDGLQRNLSSGEILEQILHLWNVSGVRPTNVVFMGMGEPLANYDATVAAARAIIDPRRLAISARKVTISTVGLPAKIRRLAAEDMPITLAISLHAVDDALRRQLMPAAGKYPVGKVLAAAKEFFQSKRREVTLEYVLLAGVNDSAHCAEVLAEAAHQLRCNVNLIRYNPVAALPYARPSKASVEAFVKTLATHGITAHVRRSRGLDSDAACGQLNRRVRRESL